MREAIEHLRHSATSALTDARLYRDAAGRLDDQAAALRELAARHEERARQMTAAADALEVRG